MKQKTPIDKTFKEVLREDWLHGIFFAWALIGVTLGLFKAFGGGAAPEMTAKVVPLAPSRAMNEDQMREVLFSVPAPTAPTVHEEKLAQVHAHRARYDANPQDQDAEALLRVMGNLYKQLGDFPNAEWAYQQLLRRFPESSQRSAVYVNLVGCYEQAKDKDNLTRVYLEMMKVFPKESNEYKFAEAGLKISHLELQQRDPNARPQSGPEGTFKVQTLADGSTRYVDSVPEPGTVPLVPEEKPKEAPEEETGS